MRGSSLAVGFILLLAFMISACAQHTVAESRGAAHARPVSANPTPADGLTLAPGSRRIVGSLQHAVRIDAYVRTGTPRIDHAVAQITGLLRQYERFGHGKIELRIFVLTTPELRAQAAASGIAANVTAEGPPQSHDESYERYLGLAFEYGSVKKVIPELFIAAGAEYWITEKIREIRNEAEGVKLRVGVLTGHGEITLDDRNLVSSTLDTKRPRSGASSRRLFLTIKSKPWICAAALRRSIQGFWD